jgi:hypothetical protein
MLYTDFQNSGIINIPDNTFAISRNIENKWLLNQFRDMTNNRNLPVVDEDGAVLNNVNINKSWFDKSNFINNFIVVRMIMKNLNNDAVYINCVNVKSRISNR